MTGPRDMLLGDRRVRSVFSDGFAGGAVPVGAGTGVSADPGNVLFEGTDGGALLRGTAIMSALDASLGSSDWRAAGDGTALVAVARTRSDLFSETVPAEIDAIRTTGYATPGDGGEALYVRAASEPGHPGKLRSADGAWWEIVPVGGALAAGAFGVDPSGGDQTVAIEEALGAAAALGAALVLPPGDITVSAALAGPGQPVPLFGAGSALNGRALPLLSLGRGLDLDALPEAYLHARNLTSDRDAEASYVLERIVDAAQAGAEGSALRVIAEVANPSDTAVTRALSGEARTRGAGGGLTTAISGVAARENGASQPVLGGAFRARDESGASGGAALRATGLEARVEAEGADSATANPTKSGLAAGTRIVGDILPATLDGGPSDAEIGTGLRIRNDGASGATLRTGLLVADTPGNPNPVGTGVAVDTEGARGIHLAGANTIAQILSDGTAEVGASFAGTYATAAIKLATGRQIAFDDAALLTLRSDGDDLRWERAGTVTAVLDMSGGTGISAPEELLTAGKGDARYSRVAVSTDANNALLAGSDGGAFLDGASIGSGGGGAVLSVNGETGAVTLDAQTIGAATAEQGVLAESAVQVAALTYLRPEDHGARGDGATDDTDAFNATIAALPSGGGTIFLGSTNYAVVLSAIVTGGRSVRWIGPGKINGATNRKLPGLNEVWSYDLKRLVNYQPDGDADQFVRWDHIRDAHYAGGLGGQVDTAMRVFTDVGPNVGSTGQRKAEWAFQGRVDNNSDWANAVAVTGQCRRNAKGAAWAGQFNAIDTTTTMTFATRAIESNIQADGLDADGLRWVEDIVAKNLADSYAGGVDSIHVGKIIRTGSADFEYGQIILDASGASLGGGSEPGTVKNDALRIATQGAHGVRITGPNATAHFRADAGGSTQYGLLLTGDYGVAAFRVDGGQKVAWNETATITQSYKNGDMYFEHAGTVMARVDMADQLAAESPKTVMTREKGDARYLQGEVLVSADADNAIVAGTDGGVFLDATGVGGGGAVASVNGRTGEVVLGAVDVGAATAAQGALAESALQPDGAVVVSSGEANGVRVTGANPVAHLRADTDGSTQYGVLLTGGYGTAAIRIDGGQAIAWNESATVRQAYKNGDMYFELGAVEVARIDMTDQTVAESPKTLLTREKGDARYLAPADVVAGANVTVTDNGDGTVTVSSATSGTSGVAVENDGAAVATAVALNFGANLAVTDEGGGRLTVEAAAAATDLGYVAASRTVTSSTGADAVLPLATSAEAGLLSPADKTAIDALGSAASLDAADVATAAQGSLASTALQPDQPVIVTASADNGVRVAGDNLVAQFRADAGASTQYGLLLTGVYGGAAIRLDGGQAIAWNGTATVKQSYQNGDIYFTLSGTPIARIDMTDQPGAETPETVITRQKGDARYLRDAVSADADNALIAGSDGKAFLPDSALGGGSGAVSAVNGQTGEVTLTAADVGALSPADVGTSAALDVAATGDALAGQVVTGDDSRLADARTPLAHAHTMAEITDMPDLANALTATDAINVSNAAANNKGVIVSGNNAVAQFSGEGDSQYGLLLTGAYGTAAIRMDGGTIAFNATATVQQAFSGGGMEFSLSGSRKARIEISDDSAPSQGYSLLTREMGDGRYAPVVGVSDGETANRSLTRAGGDVNKLFRSDQPTGITLTVEAGYAAADTIVVRQVGAGSVTLAEGAGVTINPPRGGTLETGGQNATVMLICAGGDVWDMSGDTVVA